jgi:hypothetical protein
MLLDNPQTLTPTVVQACVPPGGCQDRLLDDGEDSVTRLPLLRSAMFGLAVQIAVLAQQVDAQILQIQSGENTIGVTRNGNACLTYKLTDVPFKPYVRTLCTPSGVNVLRDSPHDHVHHHGLMFAVAVEGVDFWAEFPDQKQGRQVHREIRAASRDLTDDRSVATVRQQLDWIGIDAAQTPLMSESRTVKVYTAAGLEASLVTWQTELAPAAGKDSVTLTGSHYYGLGMRFVQSMDRVGRFLFASGQPGPVYRGKERLTPSKWVAYVAPVNGQWVTVAMFDHPDNPRQPATMFTMPESFAYISATLNLKKQPLVIPAGKPLELCYGVALWDGDVDRETIERTHATWLELD